MTGLRLLVGVIVMGVLAPATLTLMLGLTTRGQILTTAAVCFFGWGVADLAVRILSRPRLQNRTPGGAIRDWEKRSE